jgi:Tfp pilus assembly protein PilF
VADVHIGMGQSLEAQGDTNQAMTEYKEALAKDPKRADAYVRLAVLADGMAKFPEAMQWYQQALELQPDNPDILCDLGYSLYLQKDWKEAESNLRQAIALAPDHKRAHNNLGSILARMGLVDEALVEFRKGGCSPAGAHVNLAFVLTLEGRWPEARQQYEIALREEPSFVPAQKGLHELNVLIARAGPARVEWDHMAASTPPQPRSEGQAAAIRGVMPEDSAEQIVPSLSPSQGTIDGAKGFDALPTPPLPIWSTVPGWRRPVLEEGRSAHNGS